MNAEQLSRVGEKLVKRCGSRDPFELSLIHIFNVFSRTLAERIFNHFSQYSATVGLFFRNISFSILRFISIDVYKRQE